MVARGDGGKRWMKSLTKAWFSRIGRKRLVGIPAGGVHAWDTSVTQALLLRDRTSGDGTTRENHIGTSNTLAFLQFERRTHRNLIARAESKFVQLLAGHFDVEELPIREFDRERRDRACGK